MFRKQVSPRITAIATLVILAIIQGIYWRLLVYQPPGKPGAGGGGGSSPPPTPFAVGRKDVFVETAAGGAPGFVDGPGWAARLNGPSALAVEEGGSILIADSRNHRIRRMTPQRVVSTVAGGGSVGGAGGDADGPAATARFRFPGGVATNGSEIYIADSGNHRVRILRAGVVTTLAGNKEVGNVDGVGAAARFQCPTAMTFRDGALWVADPGNHNVRRIEANGTVTTPGDVPRAVLEELGDVAVRVPASGVAASFQGEGWPENVPFKVSRHSPGARSKGAASLFADPLTHVVLARQEGQAPLLVAGRLNADRLQTGSLDGSGDIALFFRPCAVAVTGSTAYVADFENNRVRLLQLPGWLSTSTAPPTPRRRRNDR